MKRSVEQLELEEVVYFLIDMTTRTMRRYTHQVIREAGYDLTIDQFVVLKMLEERRELSQREIAESLHKDNASITRIIELLVNKDLITRSISDTDRRTFNLKLTEKGHEYLEETKPMIYGIRRKGIENISEEELEITKRTLRKITEQFT